MKEAIEIINRGIININSVEKPLVEVFMLPGKESDPKVANSLSYRWDGVHVYKPGAKLILESIAPALLQIPVTRTK